MFRDLNNIIYDLNLDNKTKIVKNIFQNSYVLQKYNEDPLSTFDYVIRDGESPEYISDFYYGDTRLSWVILTLNNIKDYYQEWPKAESAFVRYMKKKYSPELFGFIDLLRIEPLKKIPDSGQYEGEIAYTEDTNKTYVWNSYGGSWDFVQNGRPTSRLYDQRIIMGLNNYANPTGFSVSIGQRYESKINRDLEFVRGSTYQIIFSSKGKSSLYLTRDDGSFWTESSYYQEFIEGVDASRLRDGTMIFKVPESAPNTLYYQSADIKELRGKITILNPSDQTYVENSDTNSLKQRHGRRVGVICRAENQFYIWNGKYFESDAEDFSSGWDKANPDPRLVSIDIAKKKPYEYYHEILDEFGDVIDTFNISSETYGNLKSEEKRKYKMTSMFEYEQELNEKNRKIKLLRPNLIGDFIKDWNEVTNG